MKILHIITIIAILITGCEQSNPDEYRIPTKQELDEYITQNKVQPILIKKYDQFIMILEENAMHIVSVNSKGELNRQASWWGVSQQPITVLTIPNSKDHHPMTIVVIHDESLFETAKKVAVTFEDNQKVSQDVTDRRGFIIEYPFDTDKEIGFNSVDFYDQNGNKLYTTH